MKRLGLLFVVILLAMSLTGCEATQGEYDSFVFVAEEYEEGITFNDLYNFPDEFEGRKIKLQGTIDFIKVSFEEYYDNTNKDYYEGKLIVAGTTDKVYFSIHKSRLDEPVEEGDLVVIYGNFWGALGFIWGPSDIPYVEILKIEKVPVQ